MMCARTRMLTLSSFDDGIVALTLSPHNMLTIATCMSIQTHMLHDGGGVVEGTAAV